VGGDIMGKLRALRADVAARVEGAGKLSQEDAMWESVD
jgi:hypothetical protein